MSGVGFNGLGIIRSRRKVVAVAPFDVDLQGLTSGVAENGTTLSFVTTAATVDSQRWQMTSSEGVWIDVVGATAAVESIDIESGRHRDRALIRVGVTSGGVEVFSSSAPLLYGQPTVLVGTDDVALVGGSGIQTYDAAAAYDGDDLSYQIEPIGLASVDAGTGLVSIDTDQIVPPASLVLVVTAQNSGGSASMTLNVDVAEAVSFAVTAVGGEPIITNAAGALTIEIGSGVYAGTYSTRVSDDAPLTAQMVEGAATPLVLPATGGLTVLGAALTVTPGLWLYSGAYPGTPIYQWVRDGIDIAGATASSYIVDLADLGANLSVRETFGGVTIESASLAIPAGAPFNPSDLTSYADDFDAAGTGAFNIIGGKIDAWENQGPGANRFVMSNDSSRPSVLPAALNGLDVVRFGPSQYLQDTNAPDFGDDGTLMIVFRANVVSSAFESLFGHTGGTRTFQIDSGTTTGGEFFGRVNSNAHTHLNNPVSTQNGWTSLAYRFDSGTGLASLWVDGVKVDEVSDYLPYGSPTRISLAASRNLGARLEHDAAQIWRFNSALSDAELDQMFTYIQNRWGI